MHDVTGPAKALRHARARELLRRLLVLLVCWGAIWGLAYWRNGQGLPWIGLPIFIASVFLFTLAAKRLIPWGPALSAKRTHGIRFSTLLDGRELDARFSYAAGVPAAAWTIAHDGHSETIEAGLSEADFKALWDEVRRPVRLRGFELTNPDLQTDLSQYHLVALTFTDIGQTFGAWYAIPHDCPPGPVRDWVERVLALRPAGLVVLLEK